MLWPEQQQRKKILNIYQLLLLIIVEYQLHDHIKHKYMYI